MDVKWVFRKRPIKKVSLSFMTKFWWAIVRFCIWSTQADNTLTQIRVMLVASIMVGYDIDFTHCIVAEIHKRAFRRSTTTLFPYLIHML